MTNPYINRRYIIGGIFFLFIFVYIIRLFYIQVIDESYKFSAENNSQRKVIKYPPRGVIYDRNGRILVHNEAAFDLMIIPRQVREFDTTDFCKILGITRESFDVNYKKARAYSGYRPSVFLSQVSAETYAVVQEKIFKFPGFFFQGRTLRKYPKSIAAHVLGYVGEVNKRIIELNPYYQQGDFIGISGVEKYYEEYLRGTKGVSYYTVDVHNRIVGRFADGTLDTKAELGNNLVLGIDAVLQEYGERLMQNKYGCIVAIDPSTGEILALVNSPAYDPNEMVGRNRAKNYNRLLNEKGRPLFNRSTMANYPPGSTFKMVNALIGLEINVIKPNTSFSCAMGYTSGRLRVGCHAHPTPVDLLPSIQYSCNSYYCNVFRRIIDNPIDNNVRLGYERWRNYLLEFGMGRTLETDLGHELAGNVPLPDYYDKYFGRNRWRSLTIISLSIGQGELGITPLQLANMGAIIANRGYFYYPHVIRKIEGTESIPEKYLKKNYVNIKPEYFDMVADGMELVVLSGTARVARIDSISVCGKTGTVQNPHGKNHSAFVAFAPKDNPKISIAVYVENSGYGSTYAAPIASLMIEKYLKDSISRPHLEERILNTVLLPSNGT